MSATTSTTRPTTEGLANHSWAPYAAVVGGAALLLKAALIIGSGNDVADGLTGALYLGGLLLAVVAAIGAGLRWRRGRRAIVAVGLVLLLLAYVMVLSDAVGPLFELVSDEAWVGDEGPIGLLGLVLLGLGARSRAASGR